MGRSQSFCPLLCFLVVTTCLVLHTEAIGLERSIGKWDDKNFDAARDVCDGRNQASFKKGACTRLIDCVYNATKESYKARLASGTSITSLLPTILALIGSPPLEIVQLALLSPWRALATCAFSIGLPTGLFRQLKPVDRQLSDKNVLEPRVREWTLLLPSISKTKWHNILAKGVVDVVIITMAVIMMWRNGLIASWTMVPWRCEWTYLLLVWPFACVGWLVMTMILLFTFKESIEIHNAQFPEQKYSIWQLMLLSYNPHHFVQFGGQNYYGLPSTERDIHLQKPQKYATTSTSQLGYSLSQYPTAMSEPRQFVRRPLIRRTTSKSYSANCIIVKVTMRSVNGLFSWRWFEAIIESVAFGIYLFATCVLTSLLFLTADEALWHLVAMTVCLSAVRVLGILF